MLKIKTSQFRLVNNTFHLKKVGNECKDVAEEKDNDNSKEHDGKTKLAYLEGQFKSLQPVLRTKKWPENNIYSKVEIWFCGLA